MNNDLDASFDKGPNNLPMGVKQKVLKSITSAVVPLKCHRHAMLSLHQQSESSESSCSPVAASLPKTTISWQFPAWYSSVANVFWKHNWRALNEAKSAPFFGWSVAIFLQQHAPFKHVQLWCMLNVLRKLGWQLVCSWNSMEKTYWYEHGSHPHEPFHINLKTIYIYIYINLFKH